MALLWIENMRRREGAALARRLGLHRREDLLRRPSEVAASRETSALVHEAACEPVADVSPDAEEGRS